MEHLLNHTKRFIFAKQKDILSSAIILAVMIIVSRIFGFMRYRTLATFFSKEELDLFLAAFRLPDFVFEIIVTGALTSAFIPLFIKHEKNSEDLNDTITTIINFISISLIIFTLVVFTFAGVIIPFITPGFSHKQIQIIISLSQILLLTQLPFLVFGNIFSGIGQASKTFILTSIAPILYNVGIILGTLFLTKTMWIYGPVTGVVIGAFLFLIVQFPVVFLIKYKYRFFVFKKDIIRDFIHLFLPRLFTVLTAQIDLTVDLSLSTLLGPGNYTIFYFAQSLQVFPVSFIGMAFGQASLPYFSDLFKEGKMDEIKKLFINSCLQLLFLTIPISLFFIFARTPIVRFFYGGQKFDWEGTVLTAKTMSFFAASIPIHSVFYFITRTFYASYDTKTPFIVNSISIMINIILSMLFIFFFHLPVWSMAIAFSIAISINVLVLFFLFYKKIHGFNIKRLLKNTSKIYLASFLSALISYPVMKLFDNLILDTSRTINVFFLLVIILLIFTLLYLFLCWVFNIEEIYILGNMILKIKEMKKKVLEFHTDIG